MARPENVSPDSLRRSFWYVPLPPERRAVARVAAVVGLILDVPLAVFVAGVVLIFFPFMRKPMDSSGLIVVGPFAGLLLAGVVHFLGALRGYRISGFAALTIVILVSGLAWVVNVGLPQLNGPLAKAPKRIAPPAADGSDEQADSALVKELKVAFRAYHEGLILSDKADNRKAVKAWLATGDDAGAIYAKYPLNIIYQVTIDTIVDKVVDIAPRDERQHGDIVAIEAADLHAAAVADNKLSAVVRVTPANVPLYLLRVQYKNEPQKVEVAPIVKINGRWAWMLGLEEMAPKYEEPSK